MSSKPIVVTGAGAVCALGTGARAVYSALCEGRSGIRPLTRFDPDGIRFTSGGEVRDADPVQRARVPVYGAAFARTALREALKESRLDASGDVALVVATNFGCMELCEHFVAGGKEGAEGFRPHAETARLRGDFGFGGVAATLSLSCSSGNSAIAYGMQLLRRGHAAAVVALAYDALSRYAWAGLAALHTMTRDAVRPFDRRRSGTLFGEGAGAVVLESLPDAEARGAVPLCEVAGSALNNNAYHLTASEAGGEGVARAMREALRDAAMTPEAVDHYSAHGTATKQNDLAEASALYEVFGDRADRIPVTALKAAIGHAMGAAGMLETIAAGMTLAEGTIPPILNCEEPDSELALDLVRDGPRPCAMKTVLSGSSGIGGGNAMVLLRKVPA
jgi:3-oxoacyl-(acyl-carrier-protein) synthase